ncbi:FAD-dependent monooxygenase [Streptomyces prunicolor]|uniref:NAD(P)/FAD-dependent oxidoreductase n=1 Tax=Streptomyces prunicolor TaxID=67348 RepID=UPI003868890E|nr:FAD-dependent monooxygenase [Streptomyces prunicolor]
MSRRAVVIGAGLAGLLAAAALSVHADEVIVLDRDELPDGPEHRKGLPQGRHAHLLMSGGLTAMEDLVPGVSVRGRLLDAGAHEISLNSGMLALTPEGWLRRWRHEGPRMLTCSRALLDWVVRETILAETKTEIRKAQALQLLGDTRRVTGVRISTTAGETDLDADFVVDASGRGSRIVHWLETLGVTGIEERTVDSGLVNATRIYRRPEGAEHFPLTVLQANPYVSLPGRAGMVLPIEGDRWMVSLAGTRGAEPPADPAGFAQYMRDLPHPILARLISGAEPLTDVHTSHSTQNARRYLEKVQNWPAGLVVLGDALATFNPAYGQGMSVAALGAQTLSRELNEEGFTAPTLSTKVQHAVAPSVEGAWAMAVGQDIWYPNTKGPAPTTADRLITRYSRRLLKSATGSYAAASALATVTSMEADASTLLHPGTLWAALNGPLLPPLSGPPLTPAERETLAELGSSGN